MSSKTHEYFIPFRKVEILNMLCKDGGLNGHDQEKFRDISKIIQSLYHFDFHNKVEDLKDNYFPFNPDKSTQSNNQYSPELLSQFQNKLTQQLKSVLIAANYKELGDEVLDYAQKEESLFHINVNINLNDFETYLMFSRGELVKSETVSKFIFIKKKIDTPVFERIVLLIRFKDSSYFNNRKDLPFEPGSMIIKIFKDIPKADMEMLFPNARVKMHVKDKLFMGIPALGGGIWVLLKSFTGLMAFFMVLGAMVGSLFTGGQFKTPAPSEMAQLIGGIASLLVLGAFVFKQWSKYKNRKILFMKALGENLYYKNLDSNAGVFHHLIDSAEEEECKETLIAYYFLLQHPQGITEKDLDRKIEKWFKTKYNTSLNFEVDDALQKLLKLQLSICEKTQPPSYKAISMDEGCKHLDQIWDNFFTHNN
jgi:Protein of unknown function (DUF3754)